MRGRHDMPRGAAGRGVAAVAIAISSRTFHFILVSCALTVDEPRTHVVPAERKQIPAASALSHKIGRD